MNSLDLPQSGFVGDAAEISSTRARPLLGRRHLIIGALFTGVTAAGLALAPRRSVRTMSAGTLESWMPARIGEWTFRQEGGVILPPPDAMSDRLYDNLVTRVYEKPGHNPIMLLLAYSATQDGMLQVHRPEFCYRAGGFSISPTSDIDIFDARGTRFGANMFIAKAQEQIERVLYWTRIGKGFPQSWIGQRSAVMEENLEGRIPDGMLARVSSRTAGDPIPTTTLSAFVTAFDRAAPQPLRALLFGTG